MGGALVLAHGLEGLGARSAASFGASYFHGIAPYLASKRLRVLTPRLQGIAPPHTRAAQLLEQIERWEERGEGERVSVIAHSQGGLDARWAISRLGGGRLIERLITLSAPHRGSALCGELALPLLRSTPRVMQAAMESLCLPVEAAHFLSPAAMLQFNEECVDSPGVTYFSLGGARPRNAEYWAPFMLLSPLLNRVDPGPNDGLVTTASARWGEYLGTINFDHVDQLNFPLKLLHRAPMEPLWDYLVAVAMADSCIPLPDCLALK